MKLLIAVSAIVLAVATFMPTYAKDGTTQQPQPSPSQTPSSSQQQQQSNQQVQNRDTNYVDRPTTETQQLKDTMDQMDKDNNPQH